MGGTVTPAKKSAGDRLERLREVFGFKTKTDFAKWLDIGEDTYRHYAEGRNYISDKVCLFLKEHKGVTSDWLKHGDPSGLPVALFKQIFPTPEVVHPPVIPSRKRRTPAA